ncbi:hypothetical protein Godav_019307 [Gossypium davidsonii]|uniref:DUF7745 domain-containing protein n=4 Tax=Gossypium TaxID=3633 RepID=A0A7J8QZA0_GOSDV|nr:hypothetical protein [Gossypium davidsonii]
MGDDQGSVLALVGDSMDNSSTLLKLKPHIVNRTSHPIRAMSNLRPLNSHQISIWEKCLLPFITFILVFARELDSDTRGIFIEKYGDIAHLIAINVDKQLIQVMVRFWDPAYQCFTFNQEDMTPTIEEYFTLLRVDNVQLNKIYVKKPKLMTFKKKLMKLTRMTNTLAEKQIRKKNEVSCVPWFSHLDILKRIDLFALAIYGLIIFPKVLGHIEVANLCAKDITWRAPWICPPVLLYKQFASRQFIPATGELAQSEFAFTGEGYMKKVRDTANSWREIYLMELALYADTITLDYDI